MTKVAGQATAFYDRYQNQILWGLVVVLLAWLPGSISLDLPRVAAESAWTTLQNAAGTPKDYVDVAIVHPNTEVANVAACRLPLPGSIRASKPALAIERKPIATSRMPARNSRNSSPSPISIKIFANRPLRHGADFESISGADTEAAVKAYEALLKEFPDSIYKEHAEAGSKI